MWECDVCGYINEDDYDDVCEQCMAIRGVNNFIDWNAEGQQLSSIHSFFVILMLSREYSFGLSMISRAILMTDSTVVLWVLTLSPFLVIT